MTNTAEYGAYHIYTDYRSRLMPNNFLMLGNDAEFYNLIKKYSDNIIMQPKLLCGYQYYASTDTAIGLWLSGVCNNWGVGLEDFWWFNTKQGKLWETREKNTQPGDDGVPKSDDCMFSSIFSCPEAFMGSQIVTAISVGAVFFRFEWVNHCTTSIVGKTTTDRGRHELTTYYKNITRPIFNFIAENKMIPTKEQVLSKIQIAYHATDYEAPEIRECGEELFRNLYGTYQSDDEIKKHETARAILPKTGRYYRLPVLPLLSDKEDKKPFKRIIDHNEYENLCSTPDKKQRFFNSLYPEFYNGNSWVSEINGMWYIINPNENKKINTDFSFRLINSGFEFSGRIEPHTYLLICEKTDKLVIHINNYRTRNLGLWEGKLNSNDDVNKWLENWILNPIESKDIRKTVLKINSSIMIEKITGHNFTYELINEELNINHNGEVNILIKL